MNRHWLSVLAAGLMLPSVVAAQMPRGQLDEGWGPRLRVTPYVGFSPGFHSTGSLAVLTGGSHAMLFPDQYGFNYASGMVTGLSAEYKFAGRFSALASFGWSDRANTSYYDANGVQQIDAGSQFWIGKFGTSLRFREAEPDMQVRRVNASLLAAGALIREVPDVSPFSSSTFTTGANHYAINGGAEAELPFVNNRLAFQAGIEDYIVFWNKNALRARFESDIASVYGSDAAVDITPARSNIWVVRVGLVFRLMQQ